MNFFSLTFIRVIVTKYIHNTVLVYIIRELFHMYGYIRSRSLMHTDYFLIFLKLKKIFIFFQASGSKSESLSDSSAFTFLPDAILFELTTFFGFAFIDALLRPMTFLCDARASAA